MARRKIGLQVAGFEEYMAKLDQIGGSAAMKKGVEQALKASKELVNPKFEAAMATPNLPAHGKYSTGDTKESIDTGSEVEWEGMAASIKVGFRFEESGMKSIFLMYGTPRHKPPMKAVKGLKDAIYGKKAQAEIGEVQAEVLNKVIAEIMEG
jgi:hypothetical protein